MKKILLTLLTSLFIIGCAAVNVENTTPRYTPHPIEPEWSQFTRPPVIGEVDRDGNKNFEISDELMKKTLQLDDYATRVKVWKQKNLVP